MKSFLLRRLSQALVPICLTLALTFSATAQTSKIATVNMTTLLTDYYKTKAAEAEEKLQAENIQKKDVERLERIQALMKEITKLEKEFSDPSLSPAKKKSIAEKAAPLQAEQGGLAKERQDFLDRSRRGLSMKMAGLRNEIRKAVVEAVQAHAATLDVDYVLDESGLTTNQVPFLVYQRNKIDLTADVLAKLNKDAPAPPEETPAPAE